MKKKRMAALAAVLMTGVLTVSALAAGPGGCFGPCTLEHAHTAACTGAAHFSQHCMRDNHHKYDVACGVPGLQPAAGVPAALAETAPEAAQPAPAAQPVPVYDCPYGADCPHGGNCPYGAGCPYGSDCPYGSCIYVEAPRQGGGCHGSHHGGHHH